MSDDLRKQLQGVIQDSPPVDPDPEPDTPDTDPGTPDKDDDRSLDNVRGELLRKQGKLRDEIAELKSEIRGLSQSLAAAPPKHDEAGNDLDKMSVQQLEGLRVNVPEENQAQFDLYLMNRKVNDIVDTKVGVFAQSQRLQQKRDQYNRTALSRYPDLGDLNSEFAREVNRRLTSEDQAITDSNPRVVLDIANDVAIERNVKPEVRRVVRGRPAGADTAPAPSDKANLLNTEEERAHLAKALKGALPSGKDFDIDRIKKREEFYDGDELNLRINRS